MEYSEVTELDFILAHSLSRNPILDGQFFGNKVSNKKKEPKMNQLEFGQQQFSKDIKDENSKKNDLFGGEFEESPEDLIKSISSIVCVQMEQQKKKIKRIFRNNRFNFRDHQYFHDQFEEEEEKKRIERGESSEISQANMMITSNSDKLQKSNKKQDEEEEDEEEEDEEDEEEEEDEDEDDEEDVQNKKVPKRDSENKDNENALRNIFLEVPEEQIIQSFNNVVLKQVSMLKSSTKTTAKMVNYNNPKAKQIEVFFFGTPFFMKIGVDDQTTVAEFLKIIIEFYCNDPKSDKALLKFPKYPQAYELRIKDDESFKPEPNFPPLDLKRFFQSMVVDQIVFMEVDRFKPPTESVEDQVQQKVKEISSQRGLEVLTISLVDTGTSTIIQINKESNLKDVVNYLIQKKNHKINVKECLVSCLDPQDDKYYEIDMSTPIKNLSSFKLKIKKKEWADTPRIVQNSFQYAPSLPTQVLTSVPISNMNLVKYEEFNVVKINDKGRKQKRVLGVDQHKISNINRRIQAQNIGFLDRIFADPVTGTKNPSRQIEHIQQISEGDNNMILMRVKDPESGHEKILRYIVDNQEDRKRLMKKVEGLMDLVRKENQKKYNNSSTIQYSVQSVLK